MAAHKGSGSSVAAMPICNLILTFSCELLTSVPAQIKQGCQMVWVRSHEYLGLGRGEKCSCHETRLTHFTIISVAEKTFLNNPIMKIGYKFVIYPCSGFQHL
jgi:hypothetical protein